MADPAVRIDGLKELRRQIAKLPEVKNGLRQDFVAVGRKVAADAQARVPKKTGRAANSIRAGVSGNNAYVAGGKQSVPYFGWLDFGSRVPHSNFRRGRQGPWTDTGPGPQGGRFLYPAIEANERAIEQAALKALNRVADQL